ncbi:MAG: hypothetical protein WCL02_04330 [bacterium]
MQESKEIGKYITTKEELDALYKNKKKCNNDEEEGFLSEDKKEQTNES